MKGRWISLVVVLVLVIYLLVSTVANLLGGNGAASPRPTATPTLTRTPRPTYTPDLAVRPYATPASTGRPAMPQTPTPAATALPAAELSTTAIPSASASPTAGVTATMTVSPTPVVYTVAAGDTLLGIALEYGVTTGSLMRANELADEDRIYIGQELIIPAPTPDSSTPSAESTTTPAAIERSFVHVVQAGETLLAIAIKVGSTTDAIAEANGLESTDLIFVGQRLIIPETPQTPTPTPTSAGRSHVVQAGETLTWIARKYGVTIEALMKANDLTSADEIYAGQTLTIP